MTETIAHFIGGFFYGLIMFGYIAWFLERMR